MFAATQWTLLSISCASAEVSLTNASIVQNLAVLLQSKHQNIIIVVLLTSAGRKLHSNSTEHPSALRANRWTEKAHGRRNLKTSQTHTHTTKFNEDQRGREAIIERETL